MDSEFWLLWFSIYLLSAAKFLFAAAAAMISPLGIGAAAVASFSGGISGVIVCLVFTKHVRQLLAWVKRRPASESQAIAPGSLADRIRRRGGLWAVALLTPVLLTVPLGTFAAIALKYPAKRILFAMTLAFAFWTALLFGLYGLVGIDLNAWLFAKG